MQQWLIDNIWLVPVYPLVAFLAIVLGRSLPTPATADNGKPVFSRAMAPILTIGATAMGLVHALASVAWLLAQPAGAVVPIEHNIPWLTAGPFSLSVGTLLDSMSVMMLFVVTFVSILIQIYTHGYMKHDKGYAKFYSFLALFNFSMLGLVLSTNLFQTYIFWELVGVSSYLLIGFWFFKESAAQANLKAFMMNRVGDCGFLIGILSLLLFSGPFWMSAGAEHALLSFSGLGGAAGYLAAHATPWIVTAIAVMLFFGPMAKSAQVPLHTWLPDAMEGPTPISALIHAATMVAAGVYLVGRIYPVFQISSDAMAFVAIIGTLTAVIGATIAITQTDIKKALAYSTMSQLGFMMTGMGVGAFAAGLFHLFTHAFFKAMLFLCSGSVIHACEDEQDMRKMGGLAKKLPVTHLTYLIGTIAISGLFWFSGFWSKDEILVGAQNVSPVIFWTLSATAGLTAFYMFRTYFMTFTGDYRGEAHVHHEDPVMVAPLAVLAIPSVFIGLMLSGVLEQFPAFAAYIHAPASAVAHHAAGAAHHGEHAPGFFTPVGIQSLIIGLTGLGLSYLFYGGKKPVLSAESVRKVFAPLYVLFSKKYYFDELYQGFVEKIYLPLVAGASARFDRSVIDGLVNLTGRTVASSGSAIRQLQSGKIQTYVAVLFFSVFVLALVFLYNLL
jgi:NAD(P)H-quinone oxidoreductase subunit 5